MGLINNRPTKNGKKGIPVWFMRQAGRYHQHYQSIKKDSDFMTMCKNPRLAADVTLGPINEFHFDAAILFSDLLFPLEQLNLGLSYQSGPPTLEVRLTDLEQIKKLKILAPAEQFYQFQRQALTLLKKELPKHVELLGFVGGPFTLYAYAVEGSHSGNLITSKTGLFQGHFQAFCEILLPQLLENMSQQVLGGADNVCLFDTAVGELAPREFEHFIVPILKTLAKEFKKKHPTTTLTYYSKLTHLHYLHMLQDIPFDVLGIDWRLELPKVLKEFASTHTIQGNFDPSLLHLPWYQLEKCLDRWWNEMQGLPSSVLDRWIAGLGHGVLQKTPEVNVAKTVEYIHNNFLY